LVIPILRNLFFGPKIAFLTGFRRIFSFSCVFLRIILEVNMVLEGVTGIPLYVDLGAVGLVQTGFLRGFLKSS
jgi:hypothetical protein